MTELSALYEQLRVAALDLRGLVQERMDDINYAQDHLDKGRYPAPPRIKLSEVKEVIGRIERLTKTIQGKWGDATSLGITEVTNPELYEDPVTVVRNLLPLKIPIEGANKYLW